MSVGAAGAAPAGVDLFWLPLGAGAAFRLVRWSGRAYEAAAAVHEHRGRRDLYHSALEVHLDGARFVIEMAPVWRSREPERGVVCEGPVGVPWLGRSVLFRYEVHCWRDGVLPDLAFAVDSPQRVSARRSTAQRVLELLPRFPVLTWGRDELRTGEMWNSNSLVAWLLALSGHDTAALHPPAGGRAPGWGAGLAVASRRTDSLVPVQAPVGARTDSLPASAPDLQPR